MGFFSVFGAVFGMCEEVIPFVLIFIPLVMPNCDFTNNIGINLNDSSVIVSMGSVLTK